MTQHIEYRTPDVPLDFPDRSTGLMVAGVLMIVMGALSGCMGLMIPFALVISIRMGQPQEMHTAGLVAGIAFYAIAATGLICGGIGSIRRRRWIRPMVLSLGVLLLCVGVLSIGIMALSLPQLAQTFRAANPANAPPPGTVVVGIAFAAAVMLFVYVVIPGVFLWFFRGEDVRKTLEFYDPVVRWTDRCPLPVLGLSISFWLLALTLPAGFVYRALPLFGAIVPQPAASIATAGIIALCIVTAVLLYRLRPAGLWLTIAIIILFAISASLTALFTDIEQIAWATGVPEDQVQFLRAGVWGSPAMLLGIGLIVSIATLAYALSLRKYFPIESAGPAVNENKTSTP